MKALDIALKDMRQSFRSKGAIIFMFVIPILITVLFSFMFGSIAGGDEEFTLPQTAVVLVNLDEGEAPGVGSMGLFLAGRCKGKKLPISSAVTRDEGCCRRAHGRGQPGSGHRRHHPRRFYGCADRRQGQTAAVELYRDPTLTIGPAIVSSIVSQVVDGMAAATYRHRRHDEPACTKQA